MTQYDLPLFFRPIPEKHSSRHSTAILCLLSSQISHQTLRFQKEVTGAELHTRGGLHQPPEIPYRGQRRGVA